jgi:hypothetical protein
MAQFIGYVQEQKKLDPSVKVLLKGCIQENFMQVKRV